MTDSDGASTPFDAKLARSIAYRDESDPLFFKWQRGESTEQEWLNKVQEIRNRFPEESS